MVGLGLGFAAALTTDEERKNAAHESLSFSGYGHPRVMC
jgi:hypothetical protein